MADNQDTQNEHTENDHDDIEQRAREQGWVPKEEWNGEGRWRPAEEFLDRGELFDKISSLRHQNDRTQQELKVTRDSMKALQEHYKKVQETEYKRAVEQLKKEKKAALIEGDADEVVRLDEQIDELREAQKEIPKVQDTTPQQQQFHPDFVNWVNQNDWYAKNAFLRARADELGIEFASRGMNPHDVLKEVSSAIRKEYPERFGNPKRNAPSGVEGGGNTTAAGSKKVSIQLSAMEEKIMKDLVSQGIITKEQYMDDIRKIRGNS